MLGEGGLLVGITWDLRACEPRSGAFGEVGSDLDLIGEREHVGGKPPIDQHLPLDVTIFGERFRFFQNCGEILQHVQKCRNRSRVHSKRHGGSPS